MNKKGFTLVELLAVIALLAILVLLALPNILKLFNQAKKKAFLTETRTIYNESLRKYSLGVLDGKKIDKISSEGKNKLPISGNNNYCVLLDSKGKISSIKVTNGTYYIEFNGNSISDLDINEVKEGNIELGECKYNPVNNCTFDGNLVQGAEYINGQYTYRYMQEYFFDGFDEQYKWLNIEADGWGVILTDKDSTNPVTTPLCTSINGKPIVSMSEMFSESQATTIDLSSFDTSSVKNMEWMFWYSQATTLDLSNFDTRNVTNMRYMFCGSEATQIIGLDKFNTSNVTDMNDIFCVG